MFGISLGALLAGGCDQITVSISSPSQAATVRGTSVTVVFSSSGSTHVVSYTCTLDKKQPVPCASPYVFGDVPSGAHSVSVTAKDTGGLDGASTVEFRVDSGIHDVTHVEAGPRHTCALLATGKVRCWGNNSFGELGLGNRVMVGLSEPPSSAGDVNVGASVAQISLGDAHTCALLTTGGVKCWGDATAGLSATETQIPLAMTSCPRAWAKSA
jgi:hypothetical protein